MEGATGRVRPGLGVVCVCVCRGVWGDGKTVASHSWLPCRTRASRSLGASQPAPFSSRARLPRGPWSGWGGGRGLDDPGPQRPGMSRPVRQIAADRRVVSLESPPARRLPPNPITPCRVGPSGWVGVGTRRRRDLFLAALCPGLAPGWAAGPLLVRSGLVPGQPRPVWPSPQSSRLM